MNSHVPAWPFAILAVLVALGIWQSRPRVVRPIASAILAAAFLGFSLFGVVSSFGGRLELLITWVLGIVLAATAGARLFAPRGLAHGATEGFVHVPGSWLPLGLMLGIFAVKFVVGFVAGAKLSIGSSNWFAVAVSGVLGILSGGFFARAVAIRRFASNAVGSA